MQDKIADNILLPCPFCGGKAEMITFDHNEHLFWAKCEDCGGQTDDAFKTRQKAVAEWNTRHLTSTVTAKIAELKEAFELTKRLWLKQTDENVKLHAKLEAAEKLAEVVKVIDFYSEWDKDQDKTVTEYIADKYPNGLIIKGDEK